MAAKTAEARRKSAQIAALSRWSKEDHKTQAERGQAGLLARFEREVDPDGVLPPDERRRRAERARRAHMLRLAGLSRAAKRKASTDDRTRHGTQAGYQWHYNRGEAPCDPCREADNAYQRSRRARLKAG